MNSSKSLLNLRKVWCVKCNDLKPKDVPHKCQEPKPAPKKQPCASGLHTYPPGSSRCRGCGHLAGD